MARSLRIEFAGACYHVISRGNERKPIYRDDADRFAHLAVIAATVARFHLLVHAYVLMDNHYHLLVETLEANLARAMRKLNGDYAAAFNRRHRRVGHLFRGRYRAVLVDRDSYLIQLSRYIHLNPVRAALTTCAEHYPWSSASAYVGRCAAPAFLTTADLLGRFGPEIPQAQDRYRAFLRDAERQPSSPSPLEQVVAGTLLGPPEWVRGVRARIVAGLPAELDTAEVPAIFKLRRRPTLHEVIASVAAALHIEPQTITARYARGQGRRLALYLADHLSGISQRDIGAAFGVGRFAVSKAARQLDQEISRNPALAGLLSRLQATLRRPPC